MPSLRYSTIVLYLFFLFAILSPRLSEADVTVRDCIAPSAGWGMAYRLPPNSGWTLLGSLDFNHQTASDYVVNAMVEFTEGNTPNTFVEYQILLDGNPHGWFTRRVPERFHTTQILRSMIPNVPGGIHTLGIQARNSSTTDSVHYARIWLSPLLVEGSEVTAANSFSSNVVVGTSWTTLISTSINTPSSRMNYLAAFATVVNGTPLDNIEYRLLRGTTILSNAFLDTVPDVLFDGVHFAYFDKLAPSGTSTYHLQARLTSGSTATIGARSLEAQTMPRFTVFEAATTSNVTIPSDDNWYTVTTSPKTLSPLSIGAYGTDGHGFAHVTHIGSYTYSGQLRFFLDLPKVGDPDFEVGWLEVHPVGHRRLMTDIAEWEQLGLDSTQTYQLSLQAKGSCPQMGATQTLARTHFQVVVIPDNTPYTYFSCAEDPSCCENHASCLVYDCTMSSSLQVVQVPFWDCL